MAYMYELYTDITIKLTSGRPDPARLLNCRTATAITMTISTVSVCVVQTQTTSETASAFTITDVHFMFILCKPVMFVINCPCSHDICSIMVQ